MKKTFLGMMVWILGCVSLPAQEVEKFQEVIAIGMAMPPVTLQGELAKRSAFVAAVADALAKGLQEIQGKRLSKGRTAEGEEAGASVESWWEGSFPGGLLVKSKKTIQKAAVIKSSTVLSLPEKLYGKSLVVEIINGKLVKPAPGEISLPQLKKTLQANGIIVEKEEYDSAGGCTVTLFFKQNHPPTVEVIAVVGKTPLTKVKVKATDRGGGVKDVRLYFDGKLVEGAPVKFKVVGKVRTGQVVQKEFTVGLTTGYHELQAVAVSDDGFDGPPASLNVEYPDKKK